ncbi:MAG: phosphorybosylanthranilate isomerase [Planctomycetes bacterium]|nr:phosphorybosylanthranilate isomerase [Planctomycetota bacterium]
MPLDLFRADRPAIGVVHLAPLPGSPRADGGMSAVVEAAVRDARRYADAGFDGLIVENHGDAPFRKERCEPHVAAALARVLVAIDAQVDVPLGVNCLRNDAETALGAAVAADAAYIRVNVLIGAVATDQGILEGCADTLLRYRSQLGSRVRILADVHVKFGTPLYDATAAETAVTALTRGGADGVIVTGARTGAPPNVQELAAVHAAVAGRGPVFVGSGADPENLASMFQTADGFIVGSSCKEDRDPDRPVAPEAAAAFTSALRSLRAGGS